MKFVTFLKIFAICFASLIGVFGVGIGVMYLAGTFTEPQIKPENIAFEYTDYDVTGDEFTVKVITTTPEVTLNELTLNLVTTADVKTTEQGTLTDGVIEIPKTAKIGEEIVVKICKTINDTTVTGESLGLDWITGGHSTISATSSNSALEPAKTNVHVDVPVYKIEVETRENIDDVNSSSTFVIDSNFYANLKFYPERSAYQYSKDGNYGYEKLLKTAYFTLISSTNNKVTQIGQTNQFTTIKIGEGEKISGYCFTTTKMEKEVQKLYEIQDEATRFESVLNELKNEANKTNQVQKTALMAETTVSVVDIDVDTMKVDGAISDVYIDRETTIYASRTPSNAEQTASNLKIELSSSKEPNVPLQSKLKNVAVNFKVKIGTNVYEEATNADTLYNAIRMSAGGYGKVYEIDGFKYYSPVLTSNINNSYWKFTVDSEWAPEGLIATIVYLDNGKISNIAQKSVSFSTISPSSSSISWKNTYEEEDMGINLKIYDDESVSFEEFNLTTNTLVPNENLYQTRKYFAYTNDAANLSQYIHCSPAVEYVLPGTQNNSYFLYEIPDGIIKAKSLTAHNLSFNVLFVTVEDDAYGQVKLDNGKYIIDQVSQTEFGLISSLRFYVTKTVKTLYGVVTPGEDTRYPYEIYPDTTPEDNSDDNLYADLAYVQNTANAFEVTIATKSTEEAEDEIFKQAISEEEIYVVAKIGDIESDIINISSITPSTEKGYTEYIFSINIGELPLGNQSNILKLFIRYQKSSSVVADLPIVTYNIGAEDVALENGIEVYDGAATYFEFGLSNAGYKTSIDNRLVVSSSLVGETVDPDGVILTPNISTTYMVDVDGVPTNVEADLFEDVEGAARIIKVLLQDKYKQQPINNTYTLKSTNQRIMLVAQSTITFLASGQAELELVDASGNTKDVIYFTSAQAGQVSNVSKLTYDVASGFEVESVYTLSETPYNFAPITINLVGATSLGEIYINSTTGGRNLVNMQYAVPGEDVDTLYDITGNLNWIVDDEVVSRYDGYIDFDIEHRMFSIIQEFGQSTSFSITLEIKELGISQQVTISIEPNVILRVAPSYHSSEGITDINRYSGVYAETPFVFGINIQRKVNSNQDLTYALFLMEKTDDGFGEAQQLTTVGEIAKIISGTESFVLSKEATSLSTQIEIQFASADQVKKYVLILKELTANDYDASISAYIYLLVNAKVEALEGIQFLVANSSTDLGSVSLENALPVSRIYGTQAIDGTQVTYELVSQTDSFSVVGTNLKSTKALDGVTDVKIKVSYCGYVLGTYAIKVAPDVQINGESGNFVLYNGENYFKLINQNKYTFASGTEGVIVADQFLMSGGVTITEINFDSLFNSNMYIVENPEEITDFFTVAITDRLVTSYSMVLKLSNGHYTTIKLILLPDNVPFVKYASETTQDLADMLSEDYLWQNYEAIHYELTGAGSEEGTQIIFEKAEFESKDYGMLKLSDNATIVIENQDEDDKLAYAWVEDNKLKTIAIGQDKYVMIKYALSNAEEALIVPYLVKIKAELSLQATYPYQVLTNNEQTNQMQNVSKNNVVMEYLAFDDSQSPVATLDLNKKFSNTIPASAMADTRIEVLRYNVATGQNEVFDGEVDFKYEISSVYVYQAVIGWKEISDTATHANINEQGVLVVNQNRALKIRLSIKLTSENGLEGYYYVSCGEIPEYTLSEVTQTGVVTPGDNIEINNESPKDLSAYKLTITTSSTTEDYTSELKFYTPDDSAVVGEQGFVTIADGKLNAEKTVKPLQTNLVLYTKYGIVKVFNVGVKATYTATANQEQIVSAQEFDLTTIITIKDNTQTEITGWAIRDIEFNAQTYKFIKYQNGKLVIGAVDKDTDVEFNVTTNLAAEGPTDDLTAEVFNFKLTFTIVKSIVVADPANAINAPLNLGNVVATETKEISLFDAGIFKLCDGITNTTYHNEGIGHFELTITNGNNAIASTSLVQEDDKFDLITNQISTETQVNAVISYINDVQGFKQYNVYVVFVVKPNFEMIVTYPKAQEDGVSLGYEKFYIGNNETSDITGKLVFNLDSIHELSMVKRLQINAVDGKPLPIIQTKLTIEKADDGQDKVFVYANDTKMTDFETAQNTDTNFKFALVNSHTSSTITFSFYIGELQLSHTYVVKIYQNPTEVYETLGINLDALDKNSQTNSETIYVGENDTNLFSVVKVKYSIAQKLDETTYYKLYFGFKGEDGLSVEVEDLLIEVAPLETNGAVNMIEIVLPNLSEIYNTIKGNIINATSNVERNKWIELYCSDTPYYFVHVAENEEGEFEEVENSQLEVKAEGIETRIKLTYGSGSEASIVDFAKTYELILKNPTTLVPMVEVADGEETNTAHYVPVSVSRGELGNIEKLTSYYVEYLLDAEFKQTQMTIETNQTVSIVGTDGFVDENNNYIANFVGTFGLIKASNKTAITKAELEARKNINIEIDSVTNYKNQEDYEANNAVSIGYATYQQYKTDGDGGVVYDYLFLGQGAPKEAPAVVKIVVKISIEDYFKFYTLTLTVKHDYSPVSLKNQNFDVNSASNPYVIESKDFITNTLTITFAKYNNLEESENAIFILHKNNPLKNAAAQFNVTVLENDTSSTYAQKVANTEDLSITFKKAAFGNRLIKLIMSDDYGYQEIFWILLKAEINPTYNKGQISVYEFDTLKIATKTMANSATTDIILSGITAEKLAEQSVSKVLELQVYDETISNYRKIEDGINSENVVASKPEEFKNSISVKARIVLTLTIGSEVCTLYVPATYIQRYTITQSEENKFVRDDTPFSLLDVIDYVDNKNQITYGEREIKNVNSVIITPVEKYDETPNLAIGISSKTDASKEMMEFPLGDDFKFSGTESKYIILEEWLGDDLNAEVYNYSFLYYDSTNSGSEGYKVAQVVSATDPSILIEGNIIKTERVFEFTIGVNDTTKTYRYKVQLVADQRLTINTRAVTGSNINLQVRFDNGNSLNVPLDANERKVYSLMEQGIIQQGSTTKLYNGATFGTTNVIYTNGLSTDQLSKLLGINFRSYDGTTFSNLDGKDLIKSDVTKAGKTDSSGNLAYGEFNSNNEALTYPPSAKYNSSYETYYQPRKIYYNIVHLGASGGVATPIDFYVTPKYIGINTANSYGASAMKALFKKSTTQEDGSLLYDLTEWAGDINSSNAFTLVKGFNTVTNLSTNEDLTFIDKAQLSFELNQASSTEYVSLVGNSVKFSAGFVSTQHHVMIDVLCSFANKKFKIGTVILGLTDFNPSGASIQTKTGDIHGTQVASGNYIVTVANIYNAIRLIAANGRTFTGTELASLVEHSAGVLSIGVAEGVELITQSGQEIELSGNKFKVRLKFDTETITSSDLKVVTDFYKQIDINQDTKLEITATIGDVDSAIKQAIATYAKVVDVHGDYHKIVAEKLNIVKEAESSYKNRQVYKVTKVEYGESGKIENLTQVGKDSVEIWVTNIIGVSETSSAAWTMRVSVENEINQLIIGEQAIQFNKLKAIKWAEGTYTETITVGEGESATTTTQEVTAYYLPDGATIVGSGYSTTVEDKQITDVCEEGQTRKATLDVADDYVFAKVGDDYFIVFKPDSVYCEYIFGNEEEKQVNNLITFLSFMTGIESSKLVISSLVDGVNVSLSENSYYIDFGGVNDQVVNFGLDYYLVDGTLVRLFNFEVENPNYTTSE